jgi:predicted nucleic acid-binding protein
MICLDTNYLILGLVPGSVEAERLVRWSKAGDELVAPAVVWYEFLCGPVDARQVATMRGVLDHVLPMDEAQAEEAARLFNATGRRRELRVDAMIAAAATSRQAPLATGNVRDFRIFAAHGLRLMG